jgi:gamma-glutamyl-gamma-aminobutyrate hydrolase PuuD
VILNSMGGMTFGECINLRNMPQEKLKEAMRAYQGRSFLLLEGGEDINPDLYGEENTHSHYYGAWRDNHEIRCYHIARELSIPILGICRGHQLMAALEGGTLWQDIYTQIGVDHDYRHNIIFTDVAQTSGFLELMQSNPTGSPDRVNSLHHQGIKRMPLAGQVLATAPDGVVEAVLYPWGLSVQWHPEILGHIEMVEFMYRKFVYGDKNDVRPGHDNDGAGSRVPEFAESGNGRARREDAVLRT